MDRQVPPLDGVHHLKLPVCDLERSREWFQSRLGYVTAMEFREDGKVMGLALNHANGGPRLALRLDPTKAAASSGFDFFSIGVPTKDALDQLSERLTELGDTHSGVQVASLGWILPGLSDPDGHEIRFYTTESHKKAPEGQVYIVDKARPSGDPSTTKQLPAVL
ncbi:glyoxalase-like domain protein [Arthrobacter alpinus]|uniref:Glyoxalase-like domain protein n=1 Tax=Arthrobacter alpinus TaxID=656366 RepID=A0A0S2LZZ8_9MICC|nr:VOC family protein [Arthrobacter alpinus]ALO67023.1 glyoxalase-like domain protein [Arthrobacter alpinus]